MELAHLWAPSSRTLRTLRRGTLERSISDHLEFRERFFVPPSALERLVHQSYLRHSQKVNPTFPAVNCRSLICRASGTQTEGCLGSKPILGV